MALFDTQINIIRGYVDNNDGMGPVYSENDYYYTRVMNAIIACLNEMATRAQVDISDEITGLNTYTFGRNIRDTLYSACRKLCVAMEKPYLFELSQVRTAHYGRDLREPLADIFIKLGILEEHYDPTTDEDYIYSNGEIIYYKGDRKSPIIPVSLGGDDVTTIKSIAFGGTDIEGVVIPEGVTTIE